MQLWGNYPDYCGPLFNDMGQPNTLALNNAMIELEQTLATLAANNPRVYHVSHTGLLQFTYGFADMNIAPGQIQPPGDSNLPSPADAMLEENGDIDCIHLSPEAAEVIIQNLFDGYFYSRFDTIFKSRFWLNIEILRDRFAWN